MDNQKEIAMRYLQQQEEEALINAQKKLEMDNKFLFEQRNTPQVKPGFHEVFWESLPSKGLFQPKGARLFIRAAKGVEVLHWSTINENDILSVTEGLNSILSSCVEYTPSTGRVGTWKDIRDCDRFSIILMIRDLTFPEPENKLKVKTDCVSNSCGAIDIEVNSRNLERFEISEKTMQYYDFEKRLFVFRDGNDEIEMCPPSIGMTNKLTDYIAECRNTGKKISQELMKILTYVETDFRKVNNDFIKNLEADMHGWSARKASKILGYIDSLLLGTNTNLKTTCAKCEQEVSAPLSFRNGIKSIFVLSD